MKLDKLTVKMSEALSLSQSLAESKQNSEQAEEHLLYTLFSQKEGMVLLLLQHLGLKPETYLRILESAISRLPRLQGAGVEERPPSRSLIQLLKNADSERQKLGDEYLSTEHVLLAFLSGSKSFLRDEFLKNQLNYTILQKAIQELRKGKTIMDDSPESKADALKKYAKNLNELAKKGKLDPVIGRDEEIRRIVQVLSRRTKNNPMLIGEPGVGKTAIVEGLAGKIVAGDVRMELSQRRFMPWI